MPGPDGTVISYYYYRYYMALGIVINSTITISVEWIFIKWLT